MSHRTYTKEDFAAASFARHTDGRAAACSASGRWTVAADHSVDVTWADDFEMAMDRGWSPVPEVGSSDDLLDGRAGVALANAAWQEGQAATLRALKDAEAGGTFVKPRSPYSAPLLAMIKEDEK